MQQHDWNAFAATIPALVKTSGDSGDSGDKLKKPSILAPLAVPTRVQPVSPLENEWGQPLTTSGDKKIKYFQSGSGGVPTVSTVPTKFWEDIFPADIPAEWREGYATFSAMECPADFPPQRWTQAVLDGRSFLVQWGMKAAQLGWTATDLFGVSPIAPWPRVGMIGLIPLLNGDVVTALDESAATISASSGSTLRYYRLIERDGRACIWIIGGAT